MSYRVKEIYYTLQGEGAQTGRAAVFCRFAGCNLWSGLEAERSRAACDFCDTDFVGTDGPGGGYFASAAQLAQRVRRCWPQRTNEGSRPWVVCTGGEPLLQLDPPLIRALHDVGFEIGVETNGTQAAPQGLDWICVSPKAGAALVQTRGDELKLVFPQKGLDPTSLEELEFRFFSLQPMDGPHLEENTRLATRYVLAHPRWRLSLQTHKLLGLP